MGPRKLYVKQLPDLPMENAQVAQPSPGCFPIFRPASCRHGYRLQRPFPSSVSSILGREVFSTRSARMLSRELIIVVLLWTIPWGFLVFSAYCSFIWIRVRGYNKSLKRYKIWEGNWSIWSCSILEFFFSPTRSLCRSSARSNGHFLYLYPDFGGINSRCSAAWNMKVTLRNELTSGQVC